MRIADILAQSIKNLLRRKTRTALTMLGVVIGCTSIVVMISIGIGSFEAQEKMLQELGGLTIVRVFNYNQTEGTKLDKDAVASIKNMNHVTAVSPFLNFHKINYRIFASQTARYEQEYPSIVGADLEALSQMDLVFLEKNDALDDEKKKGSLNVFAGENVAYFFKDSFKPAGRNTIEFYNYSDEDRPAPFFDVMNERLRISSYKAEEPSKQNLLQNARDLNILGRVKADYNLTFETASGFLVDIDDFEGYLLANKINKKEFDKYENALVKVDDVNNVADVESQIKALGFETQSSDQYRQELQKNAQQQQLMLGGIGAISLFVASIGITNTMIMAISERTREIGIMKALGCYVRDIKALFLTESALLSLMGGIVGVILSYTISIIMNLSSGQVAIVSFSSFFEALFSFGTRVSVIPWYLALFALIFSVLIGLVTGFYPALKAVSIPALEAIKRE